MKSYISILYAKTNSITDEKLSIGVIYFSDNKAILKVSEKKINIVQYITNNQVSSFLKSNLHLFENKINEINEKLKLDSSKKGILNEDYFKYLNKYSQGLISFEKLKPIYNDFEDKKIEEILLRFLGEDISVSYLENSKPPQNNNKLTIYPKMLSGILRPITIIKGYHKKGEIQLFKEANLTKKRFFVISDLYELKALQHSLSNKFNIAEENIGINLLMTSKVDESIQWYSDFLLNDNYTVFSNDTDWREKMKSVEENGFNDIRKELTLQ